ncbi:TetR/AcrR family transcriptional regulator [Fictibacillus sp. NRS-1165]|uniref:TetR/AcrR family transcriptional regulator n=1 Tax=Fictibacillus sp. NRS-1165 TaxID=3144463 RepID=UPI003D1DAC14
MADRENRKEQIIDKAVGLFAELGYYKTTTAMVAKAVGVTHMCFTFFKIKKSFSKQLMTEQ